MNHAVIGRYIGRVAAITGVALLAASGVRAQTAAPADAETRAAGIIAQQQEKAATSAPYEPNSAEIWVDKLEEYLLTGAVKWHPFFTSAYGGGGFTLGAGYLQRVGDYNTLDMRGSYTFSNYKRLEAEFIAPRLFDRRGRLSLLGGWREAPQEHEVGIFDMSALSNDELMHMVETVRRFRGRGPPITFPASRT